MKKRFLAMVMAVVMAMSLLPVSAFAYGGGDKDKNDKDDIVTSGNIDWKQFYGYTASNTMSSTTNSTAGKCEVYYSTDNGTTWTKWSNSLSISTVQSASIKIVPNTGYYVKQVVIACNDGGGYNCKTAKSDGIAKFGSTTTESAAFIIPAGNLASNKYINNRPVWHTGAGTPMHLMIWLAESPNPVSVTYDAGIANGNFTGDLVTKGTTDSGTWSGNTVTYNYDRTASSIVLPTHQVLACNISTVVIGSDTYIFSGWKAYTQVDDAGSDGWNEVSGEIKTGDTLTLYANYKLVAQWEKQETPPAPTTGTLTVTKTVSGLDDGSSLSNDFAITVAKQGDDSATATTYATLKIGQTDTNNVSYENKNGVHTWTLSNVPFGMYTVTETDYNVEGYTCGGANGNATLSLESTNLSETVALTNTYTKVEIGPAVTVEKELYGTWDEDTNTIKQATTDSKYYPNDRVVFKITATVKADDVSSFTINDVPSANLEKGSFIAYTENYGLTKHVFIGDSDSDKSFSGNEYCTVSKLTSSEPCEVYNYGTEGAVTVTHQTKQDAKFGFKTYQNAAFTAAFTKDTAITVYYFATIANVEDANQTFSNTATVTVDNKTSTSTTDPENISLKPYLVTFLDKDGKEIEGFVNTEYAYGATIGTNVPADPAVTDGTNGSMLQRFEGWYEKGTDTELDTDKAYNRDVTFQAKVTDVMQVAKEFTTETSSGWKVGDEVSYTITVTVSDPTLTSITLTEEPGPGLIGGTLSCDKAVLGVVTLGGLRTATVAIDGNTATITPVKVAGLGGFEKGDTITFTYTATLGIADTILTDNSTANKVTLTNNIEGETATDSTEPLGDVDLPTIDVDVEKTVTKINDKTYTEGDKVSKGDTVTYKIKVTNNGTVPVFGVPVIEKPGDDLINGHFVPEAGTITIQDLTQMDWADIGNLIKQLAKGQSTLNVKLGEKATLVLTADWTKVDPTDLTSALTAIKDIEDLDSLLEALDALLTKPDFEADSLEDVLGNIENYLSALLQKYAFLNGTLYVDGTYADVAVIGRLDKGASKTLTYTATVDSCDEDYKVINTVRAGCDETTAELEAQTYTVTYTDGVESEDVFPDQSYTVIAGSATPGFDGTPTREGFAFTGWEPEVAETVTEDATYTAQWTDEIVPVLFYISGLDTDGYTVTDPVPSISTLSVNDGFVYLNAMFTSNQGDADTQKIEGNDGVTEWLKENIYDFSSTYTLNDLITAANEQGADLKESDFAGWVYQSVHWEGTEGWHVHIALAKETKPVTPTAAAYKVEHYKWNTESNGYVLADTEMKSAKINDPVTATAKTYDGYVLNPQAEGFKKSGTVTKPAVEDDQITNMLVLKLYYDIDVKGGGTDGNSPDQIPDKYQVFVKYVSSDSDKGTVSPAYETITLKDGDVYVASKANLAISGSTASATDDNVFDRWTTPSDETVTEATLTDQTIANAVGGQTYTYTADFKAIGSTTFDPDKAVPSTNEDGTTIYGPILTKKLEGRVSGSYKEQFSVTLTAKTNGFTYSATGKTAAMTTTGEEAFVFGNDGIITFTAPGTYEFTVQETKGSDSHVTYDTKEYTLTIEVDYVEDEVAEEAPSVASETEELVPEDENVKQLAVTNWYFDDEAQTLTITNTASYSSGSSSNNGGGSHKPTLNTKDHYGYIIGYPVDYETGEKTTDQTRMPVKPQGNITRAEVATIFFRMLTDDSRNEFWSTTNAYSDVSEGQWFNNAISTLASAGILSGYPDGTFRPNAPITRAEFTKIAASFFEKVEYTMENPFNDVDEDDWFYAFVMAAYEGGLITGYPEGDFRPTANITRAEAVTIVNRTLDRHPDQDHFLKDMLVWPDNMDTSKWYYADMQEATNSHEYVMKGSGDSKYENWTKMLEIRDWAAFEKAWSDANSATGGEVAK